MVDEIVKYVTHLETQKRKSLAEIERANRAISRLDEKLADPEKSFRYENGRGAKKITRLFAGAAPAPKKEQKTILIKKEKPGIQAPAPKAEKSEESFW